MATTTDQVTVKCASALHRFDRANAALRAAGQPQQSPTLRVSPRWSVHATMLPVLHDATATLLPATQQSTSGAEPPTAQRNTAEHARLMEELRLMVLDQSDATSAGKVPSSFTLDLPPPTSRFRWMDGAGLSHALPTLLAHSVALRSPGDAPSPLTTNQDTAPRHVLPVRHYRDAVRRPLSARASLG